MVLPSRGKAVPRAAAVPKEGSLDASLVEQLRRGEAGALDQLYSRHVAALLHLAARLTGSMESAEDVVHDVFVGLSKAIESYREQGNFQGWLRRVVARRAVDQLRVTSRRQEMELDAELVSHGSPSQMEVAAEARHRDSNCSAPGDPSHRVRAARGGGVLPPPRSRSCSISGATPWRSGFFGPSGCYARNAP